MTPLVERTAAPIQRYSDPRLYGGLLVKPFAESYAWARTGLYPVYWNLAYWERSVPEYCLRIMKIVTGVFGMAVTAIPAGLGRIVQCIHYHSLTEAVREDPPEVSLIDGIQLPESSCCPLPKSAMWFEADKDSVIEVLRWGFSVFKEPPVDNDGMVEAFYIFQATQEITPDPIGGNDKLVLSLDLREREIAHVKPDQLEKFKKAYQAKFPDEKDPKKVDEFLSELFFQNGYRAIQYDYAEDSQRKQAWAIYDPSCISIVQLLCVPKATAQNIFRKGLA